MSRTEFIKNFFKDCPVELNIGEEKIHKYGSNEYMQSYHETFYKTVAFVLPNYDIPNISSEVLLNLNKSILRYLDEQNIEYNCLEYSNTDVTQGNSDRRYNLTGYRYKYGHAWDGRTDKINIIIKKDIRNIKSYFGYSGQTNYSTKELKEPKTFVIMSGDVSKLGWLKLFQYNLDIYYNEGRSYGVVEKLLNELINRIQNFVSKYTLQEILDMWKEYLEILDLEQMSKQDLIINTINNYIVIYQKGLTLNKPNFNNMMVEDILKLNFKYRDLIYSISQIEI